METIEVAGLRIAFERAGEGPPLVLLHGLPGDSRLWRRQLNVEAAEQFSIGREEEEHYPELRGVLVDQPHVVFGIEVRH